MNLQQQEQFYQVMSRLRRNSRAASTKVTRVTEMTNGLLVSKPVNKEPEIIDLQEYAKSHNVSNAASTPIVNKLKEIHNFIKSNGKL